MVGENSLFKLTLKLLFLAYFSFLFLCYLLLNNCNAAVCIILFIFDIDLSFEIPDVLHSETQRLPQGAAFKTLLYYTSHYPYFENLYILSDKHSVTLSSVRNKRHPPIPETFHKVLQFE